MVTVKRKINTENERYGGFSEMEIKSPGEEIGSSFIDAQYKSAEAQINYTDRSVVTPKPVVTPEPVKENRKEEISVTQPTSEEFMPRIRSEEHEKPVENVKKKVDSRTKLVLGVYITIVLLLSALVIGTGVAVFSARNRVNTLQGELAVQNDIIAAQINELSRLSDENSIAGRAYESGMDQIVSPEVIEMLPLSDAPTYEGTTNWFDSFCDWLSGVFGG